MLNRQNPVLLQGSVGVLLDELLEHVSFHLLSETLFHDGEGDFAAPEARDSGPTAVGLQGLLHLARDHLGGNLHLHSTLGAGQLVDGHLHLSRYPMSGVDASAEQCR